MRPKPGFARATRQRLASVSHAIQSDMAFEHWQRTQAQARERLLQELYKMWDTDLGDLDLDQLDQMRHMEEILGVCSYHAQQERD